MQQWVAQQRLRVVQGTKRLFTAAANSSCVSRRRRLNRLTDRLAQLTRGSKLQPSATPTRRQSCAKVT
jgi:hypothetical protein